VTYIFVSLIKLTKSLSLYKNYTAVISVQVYVIKNFSSVSDVHSGPTRWRFYPRDAIC